MAIDLKPQFFDYKYFQTAYNEMPYPDIGTGFSAFLRFHLPSNWVAPATGNAVLWSWERGEEHGFSGREGFDVRIYDGIPANDANRHITSRIAAPGFGAHNVTYSQLNGITRGVWMIAHAEWYTSAGKYYNRVGIDGVWAGVSDYNANLPSYVDRLIIGASETVFEHYAGLEACIGGFGYFNFRLTDEEIAKLMSGYDPRQICIDREVVVATNLKAYYPLSSIALATETVLGPQLHQSAAWDVQPQECATSPTLLDYLNTLSWEKRNSGGALLGGATFEITPDPFNEDPNSDVLTVTDDDMSDMDLTPGQFRLEGVVNRTYTITETVPPSGFEFDPDPIREIMLVPGVPGVIGTMDIDDEDDFHNAAIEFLIGGNSSQMCTNLILYVPHVHELDRSGLKSFLEIGPFRFAEQQQADETSMISSLIVGSTDAEIGIVTTLDLNTSDLPDEDWDTKVDVFGDDIAVDWGIGGGNSDDYTLRLFSHDDGMDHHTLGMPEALDPIEDLGSAKVFAPYGYSGVWHRFRFEADEEDEGFQIKYIDVGGTLTGRRI